MSIFSSIGLQAAIQAERERQGKLFTKAIDEFTSKYINIGDIFPHTAMNTLKEVYGKKLDKMKPETIFNKLEYLLSIDGHNFTNEEIMQEVNLFLEVI